MADITREERRRMLTEAKRDMQRHRESGEANMEVYHHLSNLLAELDRREQEHRDTVTDDALAKAVVTIAAARETHVMWKEHFEKYPDEEAKCSRLTGDKAKQQWYIDNYDHVLAVLRSHAEEIRKAYERGAVEALREARDCGHMLTSEASDTLSNLPVSAFDIDAPSPPNQEAA